MILNTNLEDAETQLKPLDATEILILQFLSGLYGIETSAPTKSDVSASSICNFA